MAFSEFKTIGDVQLKYGIRYQQASFVDVEPMTPSARFQEEFDFNRRNLAIFSSEGSRCETVIFPVLREVYKPFSEGYVLWVQQPIASSDTALNGTPDYLVATRSDLGITVVGTPLVIIIEAKRNDFEFGWGQCLAEMVATQKINGNDEGTVFGIVTDGERWQIGKLLRKVFTLNSVGYAIDDLPELFGAVHFVFQSACGQSPELAAG